jgi:hypothetical protein
MATQEMFSGEIGSITHGLGIFIDPSVEIVGGEKRHPSKRFFPVLSTVIEDAKDWCNGMGSIDREFVPMATSRCLAFRAQVLLATGKVKEAEILGRLSRDPDLAERELDPLPESLVDDLGEIDQRHVALALGAGLLLDILDSNAIEKAKLHGEEPETFVPPIANINGAAVVEIANVIHGQSLGLPGQIHKNLILVTGAAAERLDSTGRLNFADALDRLNLGAMRALTPFLIGCAMNDARLQGQQIPGLPSVSRSSTPLPRFPGL